MRATSATDGAERRIADALRRRLDEHALAGAIREAGVLEDLLGRLRAAGGGVACFSILVPATEPSAIATTQKTSHAETAVFQ